MASQSASATLSHLFSCFLEAFCHLSTELSHWHGHHHRKQEPSDANHPQSLWFECCQREQQKLITHKISTFVLVRIRLKLTQNHNKQSAVVRTLHKHQTLETAPTFCWSSCFIPTSKIRNIYIKTSRKSQYNVRQAKSCVAQSHRSITYESTTMRWVVFKSWSQTRIL